MGRLPADSRYLTARYVAAELELLERRLQTLTRNLREHRDMYPDPLASVVSSAYHRLKELAPVARDVQKRESLRVAKQPGLFPGEEADDGHA